MDYNELQAQSYLQSMDRMAEDFEQDEPVCEQCGDVLDLTEIKDGICHKCNEDFKEQETN